MFNLTGSEIIFILLIALVVLGPEKLPGAIRRAMRTYQELRKLGDGFQSEFKSVIDEPMREMRETATLLRDQADPAKIAAEAEAEAHRKAAKEKADAKDARSREVVDAMHSSGEQESQTPDEAETAWREEMESDEGAGLDEWDDPVEPLDAPPAAPAAGWGVPAGAPPDPLAPPESTPSAPPPGLPTDPTASTAGDGENVA